MSVSSELFPKTQDFGFPAGILFDVKPKKLVRVLGIQKVTRHIPNLQNGVVMASVHLNLVPSPLSPHPKGILDLQGAYYLCML